MSSLRERVEGLVRLIEASRDGFLDGKPYVLTYSDIINELQELAAALAAEGLDWTAPLKSVLAEHWLAGIHCHHAVSPDDSTYDWATCACSKVNLPHRGTVGEAVGTWIEHVLEQLAAAPSLHKESGESWPGIQCLNFASPENAKRAEKLFNNMTDEIERVRAALHKEGAGGAAAQTRVPGEDAWVDEIELATCYGSRDKVRTILRAYRANLLSQSGALRAMGCKCEPVMIEAGDASWWDTDTTKCPIHGTASPAGRAEQEAK